MTSLLKSIMRPGAGAFGFAGSKRRRTARRPRHLGSRGSTSAKDRLLMSMPWWDRTRSRMCALCLSRRHAEGALRLWRTSAVQKAAEALLASAARKSAACKQARLTLEAPVAGCDAVAVYFYSLV
jgi:hypothetical protein